MSDWLPLHPGLLPRAKRGWHISSVIKFVTLDWLPACIRSDRPLMKSVQKSSLVRILASTGRLVNVVICQPSQLSSGDQ